MVTYYHTLIADCKYYMSLKCNQQQEFFEDHASINMKSVDLSAVEDSVDKPILKTEKQTQPKKDESNKALLNQEKYIVAEPVQVELPQMTSNQNEYASNQKLKDFDEIKFDRELSERKVDLEQVNTERQII